MPVKYGQSDKSRHGTAFQEKQNKNHTQTHKCQCKISHAQWFDNWRHFD